MILSDSSLSLSIRSNSSASDIFRSVKSIFLSAIYLLPRFRSVGDSGIDDAHQDVAQDDGGDRQDSIEQDHADDNAVIVCTDCTGQHVTSTGHDVDTLGDDGAGHCTQDGAGDTMGDGDHGVLQDVLGEDLAFAQTAGTGELDVVRVHLVDHVAAQPLHQVSDGGQSQGDDGQDVHQPHRVLHVEGSGQLEEAAANFANSPWPEAFTSHHASLDEFAAKSDSQYDLIFSNPPYFEDSLQAPEERRNAARHTATGLSYREIIDFAVQRLTDDGRLALVLPADTEVDLTRYARMSGLHLYKMTRVRTVPRKAPKRIIAEFSRKKTDIPEDNVLTIQDAGHYTQEYLTLMKDFYLFA